MFPLSIAATTLTTIFPQLLSHWKYTYLLPGCPIQQLAPLARRKFAPPLYSPLLGLSSPKQTLRREFACCTLRCRALYILSDIPGPMRPEFFQHFKERCSIVLGEICVRVFFHLGYEVTLVLTTQYFYCLSTIFLIHKCKYIICKMICQAFF